MACDFLQIATGTLWGLEPSLLPQHWWPCCFSHRWWGGSGCPEKFSFRERNGELGMTNAK